jgi:hypothetical protein
MDKILQEFRIIETDDGFRIEIKGDKEQLREFVMNLDPRRWTEHRGPEWGHFPFGPRFKMKFRRGGPFGFAWAWDDDDDDDDEKREWHRRRKHGGHHPPHEPDDEGDVV